MTIKIEHEGEYRRGSWITTSIVATDDNDQRIVITLDTDETYCLETNVIGDEKSEFVGSLSFEDCWLAIATHLGLREESA
jgi:hypothetical protein